MRIVIVPGNGCDNILDANWYAWLDKRLRDCGQFDEVVCETMPDPHKARRSVWLPFMLSTLGCSRPDTIVVGHSSGAVAAMRLLEEHRLAGCVLFLHATPTSATLVRRRRATTRPLEANGSGPRFANTPPGTS